MIRRAILCFFVGWPGLAPFLWAQETAHRQAEFFEARVRPVLAENCFSCHGPKKQKGGLRLDSAAYLLKGSDSGPVVIKGDPEKSLLIQAVRHAGDVRMPPKKRLPDAVIADLAAWVKLG